MNETLIDLSNTLIDIDGNEVIISSLLVGAEATIIFITPYAFDDLSSNTMEKLIISLNPFLDKFNGSDIRLCCITKELPFVLKHWIDERDIKIEVYSDPHQVVTSKLSGQYDLTDVYPKLGSSCLVSNPCLLIVQSDGKILLKYVASNPDDVTVTADGVFTFLKEKRLGGSSKI